ncbi:MAG: RNase P modulator RnpM [Candidatus Limnocylindria bacterium]
MPSRPQRPQPQRTCVACRAVRAKRELVRIVRSPSGTLSVDPRGKAPGRGAYLCPQDACLRRGIAEGALGRALESAVDAAARERLVAELAALTGAKAVAAPAARD